MSGCSRWRGFISLWRRKPSAPSPGKRSIGRRERAGYAPSSRLFSLSLCSTYQASRASRCMISQQVIDRTGSSRSTCTPVVRGQSKHRIHRKQRRARSQRPEFKAIRRRTGQRQKDKKKSTPSRRSTRTDDSARCFQQEILVIRSIRRQKSVHHFVKPFALIYLSLSPQRVSRLGEYQRQQQARLTALYIRLQAVESVLGYKERPLHRPVMTPKPRGTCGNAVEGSALVREVQHRPGASSVAAKVGI